MKLFITLISIVFFISGCGDSDNKVFKVATNIWPGYEPLHLAKEKKLYQKNIDVISYDSATVVLNKFRKKEVNAAALTLDEAILLYDQGYKPIIIAVLDISNGADSVIAKSEIKSITDLKNKSIGVENTALGSYVLSRLLEKAKLSYEDIILVPLSINRHEEAFKQDIIDAVITFEPVRTNLIQAGGVEIFSSKDIPGEIVDVLVVQNNMKNTEFVNDILQGWEKAALEIVKKDTDAIKIISKRLKQNEEEFIASLDGLKIPTREESTQLLSNGALKNTITKISDIMFEKKLIKSKIDPNMMMNSTTK